MNIFADVRGKLHCSILTVRLKKTNVTSPHTDRSFQQKRTCATVYSKHPSLPRTPNASANVNKNEEKNFNGKCKRDVENQPVLWSKSLFTTQSWSFLPYCFFNLIIMNLFIRQNMDKTLEFLKTTKSAGINLVYHLLNTVLYVVKADYAKSWYCDLLSI